MDKKNLSFTAILLIAFVASFYIYFKPPISEGIGKNQSTQETCPAPDECKEHSQTSAATRRKETKTKNSSVQTIAKLTKKTQQFDQWLTTFHKKNNSPSDHIPTGVKLAKARRQAMLTLMKEAPEEALAQSLSWADYKSLPPEIQALVEAPFSARGDFQVFPNCGKQDGSAHHGPNYGISVDRNHYQFTAFGRRESIASKENTPMQGVHLNGWAVARSAPLQKLTEKDYLAVKDDFPIANRDKTKGFSSGTIITGKPIVALGGGMIFYFATETDLKTTNEKLKKLDQLPGPHTGSQVIYLQASGGEANYSSTEVGLDWVDIEANAQLEAYSWTETKKKVFFIRVDFSDNTGESTTQAILSNVLNSTVSTTIRDMSYGKTWIEADVSSMVVRLPSPSTTYVPNDSMNLRSDAIATFNALNTGINLDDYDIIGLHFNSIGMDYSGLAGGTRQWIQNTISTKVIVHEFGHNYGINHAKFWDTSGTSVVGSGSSDEYGNIFDIMGRGAAPEGHFHPQAKQKLAWLGSNDWVDTSLTGSGTYRIYRVDEKNTTGIRGLRVNKDPANSHYYWVGYRRAITSNNYLQAGVVLNWEQDGTSCLLDTTPGSEAGKDDSCILIGRTYSDTLADVHITPVAQGGVSPNEWIDVTVNTGSISGNTPPTATLIGPISVDARTPVSFSVVANDSNGDTLAYSWDLGDVATVNNQNTITHQWNLGGTYSVQVTITDMKGGTVTKSLNVTVDDPLTTWAIGNVGTPATMSEASYLNGRYILTGNQYAYFSIDGVNWSRNYLASSFRAGGIAYGDNKYVLTGRIWVDSDWAATAFHSKDGKNWTQATVPPISAINDVIFGNGRFVAVGNKGSTMTSLDGVTWTAGNNVGTLDLDAISFANGEFVAVGDDEVHASPDGISWVNRSANTGLTSSQNLKEIIYAEGYFFAAGWYSGIRYSSDQGVTWNAATMPTGMDYYLQAILVKDGTFVALGQRMPDQSPILLVSVDGFSWEEGTPPSLESAVTLTFGNGVFFSTQGSAGHTQYSNTLFPSNTPPTTSISGNASVNAREVVNFTSSSYDGDGDNLIHIWDFQDGSDLVTAPSANHSFPTGGSYTVKLTVVDGMGGVVTDTFEVTVSDPLNTWTQRVSGITANLNDIAYGGGLLVVVGDSGTYQSSSDAITWTGGTLGNNIYLTGVIYNGSQFVTVGYDYDFNSKAWVGVIYTSSNGSTWTRRLYGGEQLRDIAYGDGFYIATGDSGTVLRSADTLTWSSITSGVNTNLQGVSYGDGGFVVVGASSSSQGGTILKSTNGQTWINTSAGAGTIQGFFHLEYLNDRFVTSGYHTKLRYSTDQGDSFNTHQSDSERTPGLAYGNGVYFAAGWDQSNSNAHINLLSTDGETWSNLTTSAQVDRNSAIFYQNTFITVGDSGNIWQSDAIPAPTGWTIWQMQQFPNLLGNSGASDDYDGDGMSNLIEYITGSDPQSATSSIKPTLTNESGYMTLTLNKELGVNGFTLSIEASEDLKTWTTEGLTIVTDNSSMLKVRLNTLNTDPNQTKMFLHVKAVLAP